MTARNTSYGAPARRGLALTLLLAAGSVAPPAEARSPSHPGSGYGLAGSNPDLALGHVMSGIYGLDYTYDRAHYDFNGCLPAPTSSSGEVLTVRRCRYPALID